MYIDVAKDLCCLFKASTTLSPQGKWPAIKGLQYKFTQACLTYSCTIIDDTCWQINRLAFSLDLMMSSGRLPLDGKYRMLIGWLLVRVNM